MRCLRFRLKRDLGLYSSGELGTPEMRRVEAHLLGCGECREHLARLREGHRLAQKLPSLSPTRDPWDLIERALARPHTAPSRSRRRLFVRWGLPVLVGTLPLLFVLVFFTLEKRTESMDGLVFHPVSLADFGVNTEPHIVAEGYVSEVQLRGDEGSLTFRLVDDVRAPQSFVVCEIIRPLRLEPPRVGSRVRVYGVSRFDGKPDHGWYEVHPVLDIELLKR